MSSGASESFARLPSEGVAISELTLAEIVGLQGWTLDDLAENREGRLSQPQKARLLAGTPDLFGLVHSRIAPKKAIAEGRFESCEGVASGCEGVTSSGPSLRLELGERHFYWADAVTYTRGPASGAIIALRLKLLEHWVGQRQRLRVYAFSRHLFAVEPLPLRDD